MGAVPDLSYVQHAMPFDGEREAQRFCVEVLRPFCCSLKTQPRLKNGVRPDIGFRLAVLPNLPLVLEVKNFREDGFGSTLGEAIAQASDYARVLETKAFVGPLAGMLPGTHWAHSSVSVAGMLADHFNVGLLLVQDDGRDRIAVLRLAQAVLVTMTFNQWGDPVCKLGYNAERLLAYKHRVGSAAWRK